MTSIIRLIHSELRVNALGAQIVFTEQTEELRHVMSCVTCHECDGKYIWWLRGEDVTLSRDRITLPSQILSTVTRKMS